MQKKENEVLEILLTSKDYTINSNSVVDVKCDYCGEVIQTSYKNYLKGRKTIGKDSCKKCVGLKCAEITLHKRQNDYYVRMLEMCKQKGYTLITNKDEIVNNKTYIKFNCKKHGIHSMRISNFLFGKGCPMCVNEKSRDRLKFDESTIKDMVNKCGGKLLNPEDYINNNTNNLIITCPSCGNPFKTSLVVFTQHGGQLCSKCGKTESVGEAKIRKYLEENEISFKQEFKFNDCRDSYPLPFDFYIEEKNTIIEFDGRQHFEDTGWFSYSLDKVLKHDKIKNEYCNNNGIKLIRIPYKQINNVEKILDKEFV